MQDLRLGVEGVGCGVWGLGCLCEPEHGEIEDARVECGECLDGNKSAGYLKGSPPCDARGIGMS